MCLSHFANSLGKIKMTYLVVLHLGYEVMTSYYTLSSQLSSTAFNPALEKLVFIQLVYSFFYLFNAVKALLDCITARLDRGGNNSHFKDVTKFLFLYLIILIQS